MLLIKIVAFLMLLIKIVAFLMLLIKIVAFLMLLIKIVAFLMLLIKIVAFLMLLIKIVAFLMLLIKIVGSYATHKNSWLPLHEFDFSFFIMIFDSGVVLVFLLRWPIDFNSSKVIYYVCRLHVCVYIHVCVCV